jgi:hypothetical protein
LEAQEVKPAARTTAVRSSRVVFIFVDLSLLGFVSVWHYRRDDWLRPVGRMGIPRQ